MRRASLIFLLILLLATTTLILNCSRPTPTPFNWQAHVSTLAGDGSPKGLSDPFGIAIGRDGAIYVADAGENNAIRKVMPQGTSTTLTTLASNEDSFNTPSGLAIDNDGNLYVADTGNNQLRKITTTGQVTTLTVTFPADPNRSWLKPTGLALTHDGFLYVTELDRGTVIQIAPDAKACVIAGNGPGYADGSGDVARFNQPAGLAIDPRNGDLVVADGANYLVRRLSHAEVGTTAASTEQLPRLTPE